MNGSKVDDIDVDDPSSKLEEQLCFCIASLKTFHCNICRYNFGQHNQMIDTILLSEKDLDYLLNENNFIPITIIETFLALLNHSFRDDKGIVIHSIVQGEVNYR